MNYIADLHIHSHLSRATSKDMVLEVISDISRRKGISLLGTGDILHPRWREELKIKLRPTERDGIFCFNEIDFILSGEVSNIYKKGGKLRKIHILLLFPDFESVEKLATKLAIYGSLDADGRPIFGLDVMNMMGIIQSVSKDIMVIPAHIWTPWFSLFGANSGFDSLDECFGSFKGDIIALETGLSSDPYMNWRWSHLDDYTLVSNSDAHSPRNIGREANVFSRKMDYFQLREVLKRQDKTEFLFTIEFFPEEGKYHFDGHRNCNVVMHPREALRNSNICPRCGNPFTIGVLHRVEELSDRQEGEIPKNRIPYRRLVPLLEIIGEALNTGTETQKATSVYNTLLTHFKTEIAILLDAPEEDLSKVAPPRVVEGLMNVRQGEIKIRPGHDGVYGKIVLFDEKKPKESSERSQMTLF